MGVFVGYGRNLARSVLLLRRETLGAILGPVDSRIAGTLVPKVLMSYKRMLGHSMIIICAAIGSMYMLSRRFRGKIGASITWLIN